MRKDKIASSSRGTFPRNDVPGGFTLTEILIVIGIIGIMASLAIPSLLPQTERARASEAIGLLSAIRQGEEAFRLDQGNYLVLTTATDAASNTQWDRGGVGNPNDANGATAPNPFWSYNVTVAGNTFSARAVRRGAPIPDPGNNANQTICLDQNGVFTGNHPFSPAGPGAAC